MPTEHIISQEEKNKELLAAAEAGNLGQVKESVELGADVNAKDDKGNTSLNLAAERGHLDVVKFLIKNGADIKFKNREGYNCFHNATLNGNTQVMQVLLENCTELIDCRTTEVPRQTPLHLAIMRQHVDAVKFLLNNKANINAKISYEVMLPPPDDSQPGYTPLYFAALHGNLEIVAELIARNPDINAVCPENTTPLHAAANADVVEMLLNAGADAGIKDQNGETALDYAKENGEQEIVTSLEKPRKVAQLKRKNSGEVAEDTKRICLEKPQTATQPKRTISEVTEDDGTFKRVRLEEALKRKNSEKVAETTPSKQARMEEIQLIESFGQLSL
ncbi:ankyrin repeat domain-containing protein [Wolbachia endosymbiont of Folsomia candida]|uniref:ankyrin repeat domain-containing protein n=1 Tax=Wolbachia endosymbiont of Folsomia candida TaxID=169402 RepID=UPI000B142C96|nr:ankyrin repeat domain-containing protein [Wolbachia endosymbiont of Folsomia candida]APR99103.1 hypothetical protein ASM33_07955 [Wolbachia endosymbiont of Folsomia candida]